MGALGYVSLILEAFVLVDQDRGIKGYKEQETRRSGGHGESCIVSILSQQ